MCLLVRQPAGVSFSDDFLKGVYAKNRDGVGVMLAKDNVIHVTKFLPASEQEFIEFYREHVAGRDCAWHARMKTHGDIDMENCHPYEVMSKDDGYPVWMMHNGVLSTGNIADRSKSDTWHYIRDFIRPILLENPRAFMSDWFKKLVGSHIGQGNKFALMDALGNCSIVNEHVFVEHEGAKLSNTYAWNTYGTEHGPKYPVYQNQYHGGRGQQGKLGGWGIDDDWDAPYYTGNPNQHLNQLADKEKVVVQPTVSPLQTLREQKQKQRTTPVNGGAAVALPKSAGQYESPFERWLVRFDEELFAHFPELYPTLPDAVIRKYYWQVPVGTAWKLVTHMNLLFKDELLNTLERCTSIDAAIEPSVIRVAALKNSQLAAAKSA